MKKIEKITLNIKNDKELSKKLSKESHFNAEYFIQNAQAYIKAIKQRSMLCSIDSVSKSGMSRTIKFISCEKNKYNKEFYHSNYFQFFLIMGYTPADSRSHHFRISGCGMDMIFHTNYTIIHRLHRLGFINKKECDKLCQMTPTVI